MRWFAFCSPILLTLFFSACGDSSSAPTEPPVDPSILIGLRAQAALSFTDTHLLGNLRRMAAPLDRGECVLENVRPNGKYKRRNTKLDLSTTLKASTNWRPFHFTYLTYEGGIVYRALCMIPEGQDGIDAMVEAVGRTPTRLKGDPDRPPPLNRETSTPLVRAFSGQDQCPPGFIWDDDLEECIWFVEVEGIEVYGDAPCTDPDEYYDDWYEECVCWFDCGDDFFPPGGDDGGDGGDGGGGGGGSGSPGDVPYPPPIPCDPITDPDCEVPLTHADTAAINRAFRDFLRTEFTDTIKEEACNSMADHFRDMMTEGHVFRGAYDTPPGDDTPEHIGAWNPETGHVHFDPSHLDAAHGGDTDKLKQLLNTALHEAAHDMGHEHPSGGVDSGPTLWGFIYPEPPFSFLHPGDNQCIVW